MKRGIFRRMTVVSTGLRMGQLIEALRLRELEVPGEHQDGQCERERQQSKAAEVAGTDKVNSELQVAPSK